MKLFLRAILKFTLGLLLVGLLLFLPGGTLSYRGGRLFIALLFIPIFILSAFLLIKAPDLLRKRLDSKEKEDTQMSVILNGEFENSFNSR